MKYRLDERAEAIAKAMMPLNSDQIIVLRYKALKVLMVVTQFGLKPMTKEQLTDCLLAAHVGGMDLGTGTAASFVTAFIKNGYLGEAV